MHIWICNQCHAQIPGEKLPEFCPICRGHKKGFEESEKKEEPAEDAEYTKVYEKVVEKLEKYGEGCEPEDLRCLMDD